MRLPLAALKMRDVSSFVASVKGTVLTGGWLWWEVRFV
jgi:hypothetical protein